MTKQILTLTIIILIFGFIHLNSEPLTEKYLYNEEETRISKINGSISTYYISPNYQEVWSNGILIETIQHYKADDKRIASSDTDKLKFHYSDYIGSATRISDLDGKLIKRLSYTPFGSEAESSGNAKVRYKYTGQEQDNSGLYYYNARYYNTELARFAAADSWLPDTFDSQQLNRFAYVRNNPVKMIDPTGHSSVMSAEVVTGIRVGRFFRAPIYVAVFAAGWEVGRQIGNKVVLPLLGQLEQPEVDYNEYLDGKAPNGIYIDDDIERATKYVNEQLMEWLIYNKGDFLPVKPHSGTSIELVGPASDDNKKSPLPVEKTAANGTKYVNYQKPPTPIEDGLTELGKNIAAKFKGGFIDEETGEYDRGFEPNR